MLSDSLVESFRARLAALGLELADLRIGGTRQGPLVKGRMGCPPRGGRGPAPGRGRGGVCAGASGALGAWLDVDGPRGRRSVLGVWGRGFERPLRGHRHWVR